LAKKDRERIEASLPSDVFEALHADTGVLRKQGWSLAPGARWVRYRRPVLITRAAGSAGQGPSTTGPMVARFALTSQAPPRLTDAVLVAEKMRAALMSHSDGAQVFSGRDAE